MEKIEKGLQLLMWAVVILMVLIFFAAIIVGHSTDYGFLFSLQQIPELTTASIIKSNIQL
ncbi:hypothetical protein SPD48_18580 [Pseudogracilibacillus sp. SE30717A]|uniref:hypothetical protein n=1 Tax=Pseudogracilibacillus sp. SE30717A TaxID=3098293 RepID=UPI00300E1788